MKLKTRQWLTLDRIVIMTSMISSLTSLTVTILIMIIFISDTAWSNIIFDVKEWILNQQWDASITRGVLMFLNNVSINYNLVLSILLLFSILHFVFSLLLVIGIQIYKRELLIPWLVTHLIIIIVKIIIFSFCTFITFFIDILVSIVFPVASGMVLGVSLLLWRLVWAAYSKNLISEEKKTDCDKDDNCFKMRSALKTLTKLIA